MARRLLKNRTRVCATKDENCESTDYDATFVVKKGERVQTVRAFGGVGVELVARVLETQTFWLKTVALT